MGFLITALWIVGIWGIIYLVIRLIVGYRRKKMVSPYKSEYYGR